MKEINKKDLLDKICTYYQFEKTTKIENCFSMLCSIYTYHGLFGDVNNIFKNSYLEKYTDIPHIIRAILIDNILHYGKIAFNVYTDSEGCSYNSLTFEY